MKLIIKSLKEMEELKKFQSSTFDTIARRRLVEDQDTILELIGKIQELQNEINCMNDSRDFQDAESVRSGQSHVTSQPVSFPPHPIPGGKTRLCNSSEDLGTEAENEPPTWRGEESLGEQRSPNDFDYDDVTIGKVLFEPCRRRADHSEEEGLSSCLSSSVSHDRTVRPVVCSTFDSQVSSVQETQIHSS